MTGRGSATAPGSMNLTPVSGAPPGPSIRILTSPRLIAGRGFAGGAGAGSMRRRRTFVPTIKKTAKRKSPPKRRRRFLVFGPSMRLAMERDAASLQRDQAIAGKIADNAAKRSRRTVALERPIVLELGQHLALAHASSGRGHRDDSAPRLAPRSGKWRLPGVPRAPAVRVPRTLQRERAVVHEGPVPLANIPLRQGRLDLRQDLAIANAAAAAKEIMEEDAPDVGFEECRPLSEREGEDGSGRGRADARQAGGERPYRAHRRAEDSRRHGDANPRH